MDLEGWRDQCWGPGDALGANDDRGRYSGVVGRGEKSGGRWE